MPIHVRQAISHQILTYACFPGYSFCGLLPGALRQELPEALAGTLSGSEDFVRLSKDLAAVPASEAALHQNNEDSSLSRIVVPLLLRFHIMLSGQGAAADGARHGSPVVDDGHLERTPGFFAPEEAQSRQP